MSKYFLYKIRYTLANLKPIPGANFIGTNKSGAMLKVLGELREPIELILGQGQNNSIVNLLSWKG